MGGRLKEQSNYYLSKSKTPEGHNGLPGRKRHHLDVKSSSAPEVGKNSYRRNFAAGKDSIAGTPD